MASYDSGAASSITDDLKVFFGTQADIKAIVSSGKVVNRKWYLAWDTGEFFVGTGTKKLAKFGGSNNDLSKSDIEALISSYSQKELSVMKGQIAVVIRQLSGNNLAIAALRKEVADEITILDTETRSYIEKQVEVVLSSAIDITYSKTKINTMLSELESSLSERAYSKGEIDTKLTEQKTELEKYTSDISVWHLTGDGIDSLVSKGATKAICLCSEKSSSLTASGSPKYLQGHLYSINKAIATDITAGGTGTGSYQEPTITLTVGGQSSIMLLVGKSYAQTTVFDYAVTNPDNISSTYLVLTQNSGSVLGATRLSSMVPVKGTSYSTITSLTKLTPGSYLYTLSGTDMNNKDIYGKFEVIVRSPIYYGHFAKAVFGDTSVETPSDLITDAALIKTCPSNTWATAAGKYQFTSILDNEYIWFFIPNELEFDPNSIFLNGYIKAAFNTAYTTIALTFDGVQETYRCYRSAPQLTKTDSITLNVSID